MTEAECTELLNELRSMDTGAVSDALDALGITGHVPGIRSLSSDRKIAGRAIPVQLVPAAEATSKSHLGTAAVDAAGPSDVIVVANNGRTQMGGWGGVLSAGATRNGVAGVIVDGAARDIDEARQLGFAVYARATTPVTARGRVAEAGWNIPVVIGSVTVAPGDLVIADGAGVVFVPAARCREVLDLAATITAKEAAMIDRLQAGDPMEHVMGRDYDTMLKGGTS